MNQSNVRNHTRKIVQTSLFIALAVVVKSFSVMVYFGPAAGMRVSFSGVFTRLAAILSGPVFGGIASGMLDYLGYVMKPQGNYIPWLTVTAVLGGLITGFLWLLVKNIDAKKLKLAFMIFFIAVGIFGVINHLCVAFAPDLQWTQTLNKMGKNKNLALYGMEITALAGLAILLIDFLVKKFQKNTDVHEVFLKVLLAIGTSGLIVTTINTFILRIFISTLGKKALLVFFIPRIVEEIIMSVIQAYLISILLSIYRRVIKK